MYAYDELYLEDARTALGDMFDYAINVCGYAPDTFFRYFIMSGVAEGFESGNPAIVAGRSGVELTWMITEEIFGSCEYR